ncbi:HNH endonuclease [Nocardioides albertanoniae]|nr:HNH endonuclease [Nocardioides albertanoniae]
MEDQVGHCAICAFPASWNDLELTFVLDHIDGDATNNRRENLRLVCPNCDSQLPTYKAKNRGSGRAWRRQRYADGKSY